MKIIFSQPLENKESFNGSVCVHENVDFKLFNGIAEELKPSPFSSGNGAGTETERGFPFSTEKKTCQKRIVSF